MKTKSAQTVNEASTESSRRAKRRHDVPRGVLLGAAGVVLVVFGAVQADEEAARGAEPIGSIDEPALVDKPAVRVDPEVVTDPSVDGSTVEPATTQPPLITTTDPTTTDPTTTTPAASVSLVTGFDATPPSSSWTRPALLAPSTDPVYGTSVRRMTSADGTRFDRNTYSRRQAENADGTLLMTYHGDAAYHIYDRRSGGLVRVLDIHPDAEPQWHPTDPGLIRHTAGSDSSVGTLRYYETDVASGSQRTIADVTGRVRSAFPNAAFLTDRGEGSPSADGNRYAWVVHDGDDNALGLVSYDLAEDRVLGTSPLDSSAGRLDWVSASPTGEYVVAGYVDKTVVLDADLTNAREINRKADHSDIALTADGRDAYVYIDFGSGSDAGWLVSVELDTLERTRLFDLYDDANTSVHVSGKGYDKPGWVVVSTYDCKDPGAWSCDKVMAVELATGLVVNLAHTYNCGDDYWTETHAVVNRSFTRIYFNSDAGSCGIDAEVYRLAVPQLP